MTNEQMKEQIEGAAAAERAAGGKIEINNRLPYVAVTMSYGSEYFFQDSEADDLLTKAEKAGEKFGVSEADYILWSAQGW